MNKININNEVRQLVVSLADAWVLWQKEAQLGLDYGLEHLTRAVVAASNASAKILTGGEKDKQAAAVAAVRDYIAKPGTFPARIKQRALMIRSRALGSKDACERQSEYDLETVQMLSADFPFWLEEVGFGGFLRSVHELGRYCDAQAHIMQTDLEVSDADLLLRISQLMRLSFEKPLSN